MTFLRRKAMEISSWVTWLAAPGCKEWAEGLAREVEFIESDWRALAWALGSTRVLLDRRGVRAISDEDGKPRALNIFDPGRWVWYSYAVWFYVITVSKLASRWDRTSAYLFGFGYAYWIVNSIAAWWRGRWVPSISSDAYLPFKRKELELKLARSRTAWRWIRVLATASFLTACVMAIMNEMRVHPFIVSAALIAIGAWMRNGKVSKTTIEEQIERINQQIVKRQIAKARQGQPDVRAHSDHWGQTETVGFEAAQQIIQLGIGQGDRKIAEGNR